MNILPKTTRSLIELQRLTQAVAGCVTLLLLTKYTDAASMGWYYSFISLAAIYMVFDHGLSGILINKAAAEIPSAMTTQYKNLSAADKLTFYQICHASFKIYRKIALAFWIIIAPFGLYFFSQESSPFIQWQIPWVILVTILTLNLLLLPFASIIEGAGAINQVYKIRLLQSLVGPAICWALIVNDHLIWATIAVPTVVAITQLAWLSRRWKEVFTFLHVKPPSEISWDKVMLPFEARVAVTFVSGYVLNPLITLVLFKTHGPGVAGVMAVSLTIANMIALISFSAITSAVPRLTKKAVLRNWKSMDRLFRKGVLHASLIYLMGTILFFLILLWPLVSFVASRLLNIELLAILFVAIFAGHIVMALTLKVRAYLGEPLMPTSIATSLIFLLCLFLFANEGGTTGVTLSLAFTQCLIALPLSFIIARKFQRQVRITAREKEEAIHLSQIKNSNNSTEPKIVILMTTYNGEKYLREQLASIENQDHKNWHLCVSDDGSTDSTLSILNEFSSRKTGQVSIFKTSQNLGFVGNFLSLVRRSEVSAQYYALADQDDIWCKNKLSKAINLLQVSDNEISLYCARTKLIDEGGHFCGFSPLFKNKANFNNELVQSIGGGNTMVFNHPTRLLIAAASKNQQLLPSHDWWFYLLVSGSGGQIIYDTESTVLYRQHDRNLVGTNIGIRANLDRLLRLNDGHFGDWCSQNIAALGDASVVLTDENNKTLKDFVEIKYAPLNRRLMYAFKNRVFRQTLFGNLALKLALVLKKI